MSSWLEFWEGSHRIYVNERHRAVHYARVADDLIAVLPKAPAAAVLDYGCGDALEAARVAARASRLYLYDAARPVRQRLAARYGDATAIAVLDEAGLAALAPAALDLVVVNSVVQYLSPAELAALLARARGWLKPGAALVLADVVPPDAGAVADVASLLSCAWRRGFLAAALGGLVATFFSDYRRLRAKAGLAVYREAEMRDLLRSPGFDALRRPRNFGFNQARMTFIAKRIG
jgi:SAM-dependent methyltransferase